VCGAVSSFVTVITSPFVTVSVSGVYAGFPGVAEPAGIDKVGPVADDAVEDALPEEVPLLLPVVALEAAAAESFPVDWVKFPGSTTLIVPLPVEPTSPPPGAITVAVPLPWDIVGSD
jgi:hypothetical protein